MVAQWPVLLETERTIYSRRAAANSLIYAEKSGDELRVGRDAEAMRAAMAEVARAYNEHPGAVRLRQ